MQPKTCCVCGKSCDDSLLIYLRVRKEYMCNKCNVTAIMETLNLKEAKK